MNKIYLHIDTKSLYMNIKNDNKTGHTATVATPIKQGNTFNKELKEIYKIPKQIDFHDEHILAILKNHSKSIVRVTNVFIFNKFSVNGIPFDCECCFCIFIKEEIDEKRKQFGRIKLHYPISLKFETINGQVINNKIVLAALSKKIFDYAFICEGFEYDIDTDLLNFKVTIVGYNQIPYSKVFVNGKGVGKRLNGKFNNHSESYDTEIIRLREKYGYEITPDNFEEFDNITKKIAINLVIDFLKNKKVENIKQISLDYPYSLFDFSYEENGRTKYIIMKYTCGKLKTFSLSYESYIFMTNFRDDCQLFLINEENNIMKINRYNSEQINGMSKTFEMLRFID